MTAPTIHASAVLFGHRGILIRGPSGSGKSALALQLLQSANDGFACLVGDDRIHLEAVHGRLLMRPSAALQGLIEIRGTGIVRFPFESMALAHVVIDLQAENPARLPEPGDLTTVIEGVRLARLPVAPGPDALARVFAYLKRGNETSGL
ncbi:HPr kinase/phosphatase C-terminal domain-containing protein [Pseudorhodoplanes sp.]|uniref:HPr kinase/phosphorylase n=1 Tax=Pseudorhodoplanes sp. TaxID=1934341 RepID=UPI002C616251|nr:HPr kinase/phosphatase C-terminal domain-containing protein [Pseudorhodoplanes sp.]HWV52101.1 HPr kinase/phosphatase C-terminal domain-containing protein [Pseudorhodoplanes sp.]